MELNNLQNKLDQSSSLVTYIKEQINKLTEQKSNWESERKARLEEYEKQFFQLQKEEPKPAPVEELVTVHSAVNEKLKKASALVQELDGQRRDLMASNKALLYKLSDFKSEYAKHATKEGMACPECGQEVPPEQHITIAKSWADKVINCGKDIATTESKLQKIIGVLNEAEANKTKWEEEQKQASEILMKARNHNNAISGYFNKRNFLSEKCKDLRDVINPFIKQIEDDSHRVEIEEDNGSRYQKEINLASKVVERLTFWETRFPQIRLMILDNIVAELDIFFNQAFNKLGLVDHSCKVSTERELKNENIRRELNIKIVKNVKGEAVEKDYEDLSGGEKQRIRLAVDTGISELIRSKEDCQWKNFVMYDELSDNLSPEGMADLLDLMEILSENQTTLFVDHGVLQESHFSGIFTFVKDTSGNSTLNERELAIA